MTITLQQLAKLAGVSKSTVFRALQGEDRIAPATRERIQRLAKEHGYAPLVRAPLSTASHQRTIGFLVPNLKSSGDTRILETLGPYCRQHRFSWQLFANNHKPVVTLDALQYFAALPVDGIVIHTGHLTPLPRDVIQHMQSQRISIITYDFTPAEVTLDHVGIDEAAVGEMAVDYLYGLGHRRIAVLGHFSKGAAWISKGVIDALARRGLPTDLCVDYDYRDIARELSAVLCSETPATAAIAESDEMAYLALSIIHRLGIDVPHQLSVLGVGNNPISPYMIPPLTTLALPLGEVAKSVVELLFERIAHPIVPTVDTVKRIAFKPHLIQRASCAPPSRRSIG
jgi:DNA-binding LacI/PurR family transcriptional regulator